MAIGSIWFFSDKDAPELTSFELSAQAVSISQDGQFEFSGSFTDARGVTAAQFECVENGEPKLLIFLAMQGNDRNRVSFGKISGSASWTGRWTGTAYDVQFEGIAPLSESFDPTSCSWYASLGDIVGNRVYQATEVSLELTD